MPVCASSGTQKAVHTARCMIFRLRNLDRTSAAGNSFGISIFKIIVVNYRFFGIIRCFYRRCRRCFTRRSRSRRLRTCRCCWLCTCRYCRSTAWCHHCRNPCLYTRYQRCRRRNDRLFRLHFNRNNPDFSLFLFQFFRYGYFCFSCFDRSHFSFFCNFNLRIGSLKQVFRLALLVFDHDFPGLALCDRQCFLCYFCFLRCRYIYRPHDRSKCHRCHNSIAENFHVFVVTHNTSLLLNNNFFIL